MRGQATSVRVFAPGTVSNVGCGFDVFGFAIDGPGDLVEARLTERSGVRLAAIDGDDGVLPRDAERNTAGIAAAQVLERAGFTAGIELRLEKRMPLSSGLGSSAASAVAAAVAVDVLLRARLPKEELLLCALEAERVACGAAHGDNAAPSLYGGFVLVRARERVRVDALPVPVELTCAILRPHLSVDTGAARRLLGDQVPLARAVLQWGNTAALVAALFRQDWDLLASAIEDVVAEPLRRALVPGFGEVKSAALAAGALGCSLSGSGPAIFALCQGEIAARRAIDAMAESFAAATGIGADRIVSRVGATGARVLDPVETVQGQTGQVETPFTGKRS